MANVFDFKNLKRNFPSAVRPFDQRAWEQNLANELYGYARTPLDMSFQTPEFKAAQEEATIAPIRRSFGIARRQGINQSLRTGGPVGAFINANAGAEADAVRNQGAQNFLANTEFGADLASRKFNQAMGAAGYQGNLYQNIRDTETAAREKRGGFGKFVKGAAGLAGTLAGGGINPFSIFRRKPKMATFGDINTVGTNFGNRNFGFPFPV